MFDLNKKQQEILNIVVKDESLQSSEVFEKMSDVSLVTVKRALSDMARLGLLNKSGSGRSVKYSIGIIGRIFLDIDARKYCSIDPDERFGLARYNFEFLSSIPSELFSKDEINLLNNSTANWQGKIKNITPVIQEKELKRFVIELAWKSSKIEGNTYSLVDTEQLILNNKEAKNRTKEETQMILNHRDAFHTIFNNPDKYKKIKKGEIEEIHFLLTKDLKIKKGFRQSPVGITGSIFRPLDNSYQISEAVDLLEKAITQAKSPFSKALIALLGISYIQPFEDGNKRTARFTANAILISNNLPPISYRSVDERDYRDAILTLYEINSIIPIKKIFINQYDFTANNYTIAINEKSRNI
ncbi:MAG: Fic family protein [Candidatus Pacebacteria bacterium]|nr:Fic family protein [Candidatus Paceibacterota bacterium]